MSATRAPGSTSSSALADVAVLGGAAIVATVISAIANIVAARLLGPADYGIWQTARMIIQYSTYASLGVGLAMHREIPYLAATAEAHSIDTADLQRQIIRVTFWFTVLTAAVVGLAAVIFGSRISTSIPIGLYGVVAVVVLTQQMFIFADRLATSYGRYALAGLANVVTSCLCLVLGIAGIELFGVAGLFWSQVCWSLVGTLLIMRAFHIRLLPDLSPRLLRRLVRIGVPTMGNGLLSLLTKSIDRVAILAFLGTTSLGYYGLALSTSSFIEQAFQPIGRVVLQRSAAAFAVTNDPHALRRPIIRVLHIQVFAFALLVGVAYVSMPLMVRLVLPQYESAIAPTIILMFGAAFLSLRSTLVHFLLAADRLLSSYPLQIAILIPGIGGIWFSMHEKPTILMAAIVTAAVFTVMGVAFVAQSLLISGAGWLDSARTIAVVVMPLVYTATLGWLLSTPLLHLSPHLPTAPLAVRTCIAIALFVAGEIPMVMLAEHSAGAATECLAVFRLAMRRIAAHKLPAGSGL